MMVTVSRMTGCVMKCMTVMINPMKHLIIVVSVSCFVAAVSSAALSEGFEVKEMITDLQPCAEHSIYRI